MYFGSKLMEQRIQSVLSEIEATEDVVICTPTSQEVVRV